MRARSSTPSSISTAPAAGQWDMLPHDFPAKSTVSDYFAQYGDDDGTWQRMMDALRYVGSAKPPAMSPSRGPPASTARRSRGPRSAAASGGYDGGKKIRGVKRHIVVDSLGLLLVVMITAASLDDGTGAPGVLGRLTAAHRSRLEAVRGDTKYRNHALDAWLEAMAVRREYVVEVIERPPGSKGYVKLPKLAGSWNGRSPGSADAGGTDLRDYELDPHSSEAFIKIGSIHLMLRRLQPDETRPSPPFKYRKNQEIVTG